MADNSLNGDVAAVVWATAADASTHETMQEGKARAAKSRKRSKPLLQESPSTYEEQASGEPAHEIDSFA